MAAVVIVGVQPAGVGVAAFGFGVVGVCVGPFFEEGAVEAFDCVVGLWPVRPGAFVDDVRAGEGVAPESGFVAGPVVGEYSRDGDAVACEKEGVGSVRAKKVWARCQNATAVSFFSSARISL